MVDVAPKAVRVPGQGGDDLGSHSHGLARWIFGRRRLVSRRALRLGPSSIPLLPGRTPGHLPAPRPPGSRLKAGRRPNQLAMIGIRYFGSVKVFMWQAAAPASPVMPKWFVGV